MQQKDCLIQFQSTPPIRVATIVITDNKSINIISIHATHTGGDYSSTKTQRRRIHFNPRHPYGWRQIRWCVFGFPLLFQSTPPIRVATNMPELIYLKILFQSTPPIRVATSLCSQQTRTSNNFNPRHPYGWRPGFSPGLRMVTTFQSTPPIRVATRLRQTAARRNTISIHATHTGGDI